ncbi:hypothetical protein CTAM01_06955 [Colletotrichum tamarilloi]|uniref:Uncharacterized protein n=1 Tax=Colletotrichum tamarilloi TaxID=1209934 RepID=A0ABQ9RAM6_9PEZI|nr:uncharacterized protein CTAM01_06955 [Colletotrichum tamarilloi]KAK1499761.1 hypothetical protein CTAM01_06955 [Colletotrichum tamarilloi]
MLTESHRGSSQHFFTVRIPIQLNEPRDGTQALDHSMGNIQASRGLRVDKDPVASPDAFSNPAPLSAHVGDVPGSAHVAEEEEEESHGEDLEER